MNQPAKWNVTHGFFNVAHLCWQGFWDGHHKYIATAITWCDSAYLLNECLLTPW